jgi:hypothetical protein
MDFAFMEFLKEREFTFLSYTNPSLDLLGQIRHHKLLLIQWIFTHSLSLTVPYESTKGCLVLWATKLSSEKRGSLTWDCGWFCAPSVAYLGHTSVSFKMEKHVLQILRQSRKASGTPLSQNPHMNKGSLIRTGIFADDKSTRTKLLLLNAFLI